MSPKVHHPDITLTVDDDVGFPFDQALCTWPVTLTPSVVWFLDQEIGCGRTLVYCVLGRWNFIGVYTYIRFQSVQVIVALYH